MPLYENDSKYKLNFMGDYCISGSFLSQTQGPSVNGNHIVPIE